MKRSLGTYQLASAILLLMVLDYTAWRVMDFNSVEAQVLHFVGSLVMPIVCYLVVLAFKMAENNKNYFLRMTGFWILSIYPYKAFMGNVVPFRQNLLFEMVLVLATLNIIELMKKKSVSKIMAVFAIVLMVLSAVKSGENPILSIGIAIVFYGMDVEEKSDKGKRTKLVVQLIMMIFADFFVTVMHNIMHQQKWYQDVFVLGSLLAIPIIIYLNYRGKESLGGKKSEKVFYFIYLLQFIVFRVIFDGSGYSFFQFYLNLNIITAILMVAYGMLALKAKPSKAQLANIIMLIFGLFYIAGFYIQLTTKDVRVVQLAYKIEYTGMVGVIMAFTKFVDEFYSAHFPKWIYAVEEAISIWVIIGIYAIRENTIFFKYIILSIKQGYTIVYAKPGILYLIFLIYVICVFAYIITFAVRNMRRSKKEERKRCLYLLLGASCPCICIFGKATGLTKGFDCMTFGILGFIFFFTIALIKDEYFDTMMTEAEKDPLTGVCNRRYFVKMVELNLSKRKRGSLVMVDLDNFKIINDRYGHGIGDKVLTVLGNSLKQAISEMHLISRIGGDEFCIYLVNVTRKSELQSIVENLEATFQDNMNSVKLDFQTTLSIGISVYKGKSSMEFEILYEEADKALYLAKNSGKSQYKFY